MRFEENGNSARGMNSDPSIVERVRTNDVAHARNRAARHGWVERDMRELRAEIIVGGLQRYTIIGLLKWLEARGIGVIIVAAGLCGRWLEKKKICRQDTLPTEMNCDRL